MEGSLLQDGAHRNQYMRTARLILRVYCVWIRLRTPRYCMRSIAALCDILAISYLLAYCWFRLVADIFESALCIDKSPEMCRTRIAQTSSTGSIHLLPVGEGLPCVPYTTHLARTACMTSRRCRLPATSHLPSSARLALTLGKLDCRVKIAIPVALGGHIVLVTVLYIPVRSNADLLP